jgi:hypothetical protein
MVKRIGIGMLVIGFVLAIGTAAQAVPSLGVGTGTVNCSGAAEYWQCFSLNSASGSGESFVIPASGETNGVTPWSNIAGVNIWLVAESSLGNITFTPTGGATLNPDPTATFGNLTGYNGSPFQAINLGQIGSAGWTAAPAGPFVTGEDPFWFKTGTLTYTGGNITGDWLFLVASANNDLSHPPDAVSPKTTSAVPEPGTALLLGSGILGLVLYRRKFQA